MRIHFPLFILVLLIVSCQKEISSPTLIIPPVIPPVTSDSILVSKIIGFDTTRAAPNDTIYILKNTYDNMKRLSNTVLTDYIPGVMPSVFSNATYYYQGSDSLPYKSISVIEQHNFDTTYYNYDLPIRRLIYDSSVTKNDNTIPPDVYESATTIGYFGNTVVTTIRRYQFGVYQNTVSYPAYQTFSNGDLVTQRDTTWAGEIESFNLRYDANPNPLYSKSSGDVLSYGDDYLVSPGTRHNLVERIETTNGGVQGGMPAILHIKYFYKYKGNGYPLEVNLQDLGSTTPRNINKIKYQYTN